MNTKKMSIEAPDNCTSCSLCANVCPNDAISMVWNRDGFLVPSVDDIQCVNCGLCVKKCPAINQNNEDRRAIHPVKSIGYAAWSTDSKILRESSSGGIFSELAQHILSLGGAVYGVKWVDGLRARFSRIEKESDLSAFRGSKYVQAEPGLIYRNVSEDLKAGRTVLFAGTPCQVNALNLYLRKVPENLITVSLACHGVPSLLLADRYVEEKEAGCKARMKDWQFRNKLNGWMESLTVNEYDNGRCERTIKHKDDYMRGFLSDIAMKKGCFTCPHSYVNNAVPEIGDIALGDFWNVSAYHPDWNIFNGVSTVLCHSDKGRRIVQLLQEKGRLVLHEEDYLIAQHPTRTQLGYSADKLQSILKKREKTLNLLRKKAPLKKVLRLTERQVSLLGIRISEMNPLLRWSVRVVKRIFKLPPNNRVGILTESLYSNYGGLLQAFAMQEVMRGMGRDAVTIQYSQHNANLCQTFIKSIKNRVAEWGWRLHILPATPIPWRVQGKGGRGFLKKYIRRTRLFSVERIGEALLSYRISNMIVGSDQVWNATAKPLPMPFYYLDWCGEELRNKSVSYAASFGKDYVDYKEDDINACSALLSQFKAVSTRESSGVSICKAMGVTAVQLPDPTLLLPFEIYDNIIDDFQTEDIPAKTLAAYVLDKETHIENLLHDVSEILGLNLSHMNVVADNRYRAPISVAQWLRGIRDGQCLITDSFHGCVFSIIYNKPFVCLGNEGRGNARFDTLLGTFGLKDRMLTKPTTEDVMRVLNTPIDWYSVNAVISIERERGINFLKENLTQS